MKKLVFAILATLVFVSNAMANGYCNRTGGAERERCYKSGAEMETNQAQKYYVRVMTDPNLPQSTKDKVWTDQDRWVAEVNRICGNSWECYYTNVRDRKNALIVWMSKNGVPFK